MAFLDLKYDAFGLDINDLSVKIIKLAKNGKIFSINSFGQAKIKPGIVESGVIKDEKALAEIIKSACKNVKGKRLNTKYVVASLPEEESFLQVIQMPKMSENELRSAVVFEAENYIPLPINDVYLDFRNIVPVKNSLDHMDVLVVATPKKIVDSYVSCLKMAGLIPVAFEVESQSILTAVIENERSEYPLAVVDIGEDAADFIVFCGYSIRFTYSMPVSSAQLTKAISENLKTSIDKAEDMKIKYGISEPKEKASVSSKKIFQAESKVLDEFVSQISKYIEFYQDHASHEHVFTKGGIQKIFLCGGGAHLKGLPEFLTKKIGVQTEIANPFINIPQKNKNKFKAEDFLPFATALGLAIKGINFREE